MPATRTVLAKDVSRENREDHPVVQHLQRQVANPRRTGDGEEPGDVHGGKHTAEI
jgi:hypothetical protein